LLIREALQGPGWLPGASMGHRRDSNPAEWECGLSRKPAGAGRCFGKAVESRSWPGWLPGANDDERADGHLLSKAADLAGWPGSLEEVCSWSHAGLPGRGPRLWRRNGDGTRGAYAHVRVIVEVFHWGCSITGRGVLGHKLRPDLRLTVGGSKRGSCSHEGR
jgi:hypothetical protein